MKVHWFALLLITAALLIMPAVSAKIVEEKNGYMVTPGSAAVRLPEMSLLSSGSLSQGQTNWYTTYVSSGKTSFYTNLNWGNPSNSLALTIYAPDAVFGPYYDSADGRIDGRINLRISKSGGLTSGTWYSGVYGYSVSGVQSYSYTAYSI
jgi:hypothetical protein